MVRLDFRAKKYTMETPAAQEFLISGKPVSRADFEGNSYGRASRCAWAASFAEYAAVQRRIFLLHV